MPTDLLDAPSNATPTDERPRRRRRVLWLAPFALVGGLALGLVLRDDSSDGGSAQAGYAPQVTLAGVQPGAATGFDTGEAAPSAAAPSAIGAVTGFLDAEIAGAFETSYGLLAADDRADVGNAQDWAVLHDELPVYLGYTVRSEADGIVVVDARFEPQVNEVVGVQPAAAQITFDTRREDGGHRIAWELTRVEPRYPVRDLAAAAALAWVTDRQQCMTSTAGQYEGSLLGDLGVAEGLCGVAGQPVVTPVGELDSLDDPTFVLSAFGGGAVEWAAVVGVSGLVGVAPLEVVLAPYDDTWLVIGVTAA